MTFAESSSHADLAQLYPVKYQFTRHRVHELLHHAISEALVLVAAGFQVGDDHRKVDVAVISRQRAAADPEQPFIGVPDIVIDVPSPSYLASEWVEKEAFCLENGALEFWLVDLDHRLVLVATSDDHFHTYGPGDQVPLHFGGSIAVNDIFS